jgi:hypothetical protein
MKRKNLLNLLIVFGLALALTGGVAMAHRAWAQEGGPQGALGPQAAVGTGFTYQGRLLDNGTPVDGECDFGLSLYGSPAGLDQIGTTEDKSSISVSDGYFTITDLDFGAGAFDGNDRYLEIAVDCGGGSVTLDPRVALNAAPYAHSLRPGAVVSGTVSTGLQVQTNAGGTAQALLGHASSRTGQSNGVYGSTNSWDGGAGVVGRGEATTGKAYGVAGVSFSTGGTGVYGTAPTTGTVGIATSNTGVNYGVYGRNASYSGAGVYGESSNSGGTGVRGYSASGPGVAGSSTSGPGVAGSSTSGPGVWGYSTSGHAIWSEGDTHINGNLTWVTRTSYIAVSAAAFGPVDENYMYTNWGNTLAPKNMITRYYYAPVQLPHGATVTKIKFYWSDVSGDYNGRCYLYRNDMQGGGDTLGTVDTSSGTGSSETTTITNPVVDNSQYAYYLGWDLEGGGDVEGYGVVIEYTISEPY